MKQTSSINKHSNSSRAIAIFLAFAFLLCCIRAFVFGPWLLVDVDLGWHLGYGEFILDHRQLPDVDSWSWTRNGHAYQLTQWGGETLLGIAYRVGGYGGLLLLNCIAVSFAIALMFAVARSFLSDGLAAIVTWECGFMLLAGLVRPNMLSWAFAAGLAWLCVRVIANTSYMAIAAMVGLSVVWVNVHGSFALGTVVSAAFLLCSSAHRLVNDRRREAIILLTGSILVVVATAINPYGFKVWDAVLAVAKLETTRTRYFGDWKTTDMFSGLALPAWIAASSGIVAVLRRQSLWLVAVACGVVALSLSAQRNAGFAAVAASALASMAIKGCWLDQKLREELKNSMASPLWLPGICAACAVAAFAVATSVSEARVSKAAAVFYPFECKKGLDALAKSDGEPGGGQQIRIVNEFEHGGWWQRQEHPPLVSIDGRADLFGDQPYWDLETLKRARPGWQRVLNELNPDAICLGVGSKVFLEPDLQVNYRLFASDEKWALWVKRKSN